MVDKCRGCGRPIVPHEDPRYTGREPEEFWHYSCWEKTRPEPTNTQTLGAQMATTIRKAERALDELRDGLRRRR